MEETKPNQIEDSVLIIDTETQVFGKPNPEKDIMKLFSCYSYKTKKTYVLTKTEDIQKTINAHKYIVGFNTKNYDIPIMARAGIKIEYKYIIDLQQIFMERAGVMKIKSGMLKDLLMHYSLDYITKTLGITNENDGKMKIDYNVFKKDVWTEEETRYITEYTKRDIEVTKKLYEWLEAYFESLKEFLNDNDVK
jgi:uncharacterized protein YprB with RNaseH-like and TPR domain